MAGQLMVREMQRNRQFALHARSGFRSDDDPRKARPANRIPREVPGCSGHERNELAHSPSADKQGPGRSADRESRSGRPGARRCGPAGSSRTWPRPEDVPVKDRLPGLHHGALIRRGRPPNLQGRQDSAPVGRFEGRWPRPVRPGSEVEPPGPRPAGLPSKEQGRLLVHGGRAGGFDRLRSSCPPGWRDSGGGPQLRPRRQGVRSAAVRDRGASLTERGANFLGP